MNAWWEAIFIAHTFLLFIFLLLLCEQSLPNYWILSMWVPYEYHLHQLVSEPVNLGRRPWLQTLEHMI